MGRYYSVFCYSAFCRIFWLQQNIRFRQIVKIWVSVGLLYLRIDFPGRPCFIQLPPEDEEDAVSGGADGGHAASEAIVEITKQELDNVVKALSVRLEDLLTCSNLIGKEEEKSCARTMCAAHTIRVGEDTFEMYLRYRYMKGCIFCIFWILRYSYH